MPSGIKTPVDEDHDMYGHHHPAAGGGGAAVPAPAGALHAPGAGAGGVYPIPRRSYVLAPRPGWRAKPGYQNWDIDHERFEIKKSLGKGSYGTVVEAIDHLTGKKVAIKKIVDVFSVFENAKRIYREVRRATCARARARGAPPPPAAPHTPQLGPRALTPRPHPPSPTPRPRPQVRILSSLKNPNIVSMLYICQPGVSDPTTDLLNFEDLYVVFECLDTDLAKLCRDETQCLTVPHVRCVVGRLFFPPRARAPAP